MLSRRLVPSLFLLGLALTGSSSASAQGLLWSLPEDGTWVRFEGKLTQTQVNPDAANNQPIEWLRHVTIKSVGTKMGDSDFPQMRGIAKISRAASPRFFAVTVS